MPHVVIVFPVLPELVTPTFLLLQVHRFRFMVIVSRLTPNIRGDPMKPHTLKGRTKAAAEPETLSPTSHVLERIRVLTAELRALQDDIQDQTGERAEQLAQTMVRGDQASAQALEDFRAVVDQIRSVLWLCSEEAGAEPVTRDGRHRFSRGGAGLRSLSSESRAETMRSQTRDAVSFFDRLDRVIDNYMQAGGPIVDRGPGKRPKT